MRRARIVVDVTPELSEALRKKCAAEGVTYANALRSFMQRFVDYENFHYVLIPPGLVQRWLARASIDEEPGSNLPGEGGN